MRRIGDWIANSDLGRGYKTTKTGAGIIGKLLIAAMSLCLLAIVLVLGSVVLVMLSVITKVFGL